MEAQMIMKPDCVLGLATGSSPEGIYKCLIEDYRNKRIDFSEVKTLNLDEYCGLAPENEQSYRYFMEKHLFAHVNLQKENIHIPDGMAADAEKECARYEALVAEMGGADLQLLGIGHNGHIAFNEPGSAFIKETHVVELTERTREANKRFFNSIDEVPGYAFTMGIGSILKAKKILLIASGKDKADAVKKAFFGPVTPEVPASILQFHKDVTLVVDEDALP